MIPSKKSYLQRFYAHKDRAKRRGIPFRLTFQEWLEIWKKSGHLDNRGTHADQYAMARFGDKGAYEVGNVCIITASQNAREGSLLKKRATISKSGGVVYRARHTMALSQTEFGKAIGVCRKTIMRYESGNKVPKRALIVIRALLKEMKGRIPCFAWSSMSMTESWAPLYWL